MGWYFLPHGFNPNTDTLQMHEVMWTEVEIETPHRMRGISFYLEDDDALREVLDALGYAEMKFKMVQTNLEGIFELVPSSARNPPLPTEIAIKRAKPDAETFLDATIDRKTMDLEKVQKKCARSSDECAEARNQFIRAAEKNKHLLLQRMLLEASDETLKAFVKAECKKIAENPYVKEIRFGKRLFIIDLHPIAIELHGQGKREIGELTLTISLSDGSIKVECAKPLGPSAHPCVAQNGYLALGSLRDAFVRYVGARQYATAVKLLIDLLRAVPKTETLRDRLTQWPIVV